MNVVLHCNAEGTLLDFKFELEFVSWFEFEFEFKFDYKLNF